MKLMFYQLATFEIILKMFVFCLNVGTLEEEHEWLCLMFNSVLM